MIKILHYRIATASVFLLAASYLACAAQALHFDPVPEPLVTRVADRVLTDFPSPPEFNWGEGVLMTGMMRAGIDLQRSNYIAFVRHWADHWRKLGIGSLLQERGYCGHWGPALPLLMLHQATGDSAYLAMAREVVQFVQTRALRTSDDFPGSSFKEQQIWVDALWMCCPVFTRMALADHQPKLLTQASHLLAVCARHCQDSKTGLFWHMYDEPSRRIIGPLWARGNGWTAMAYVDVLSRLDRSTAEFAARAAEFRRLVDAIFATQDRQTRLWHTILDRPDTYLETSASAMFLRSMVQARRAGLLQAEPGLIEQTWAALATKVDPQGRVFDVSGGTDARTDIQRYITKIRGTYTWGTGAFLLAALECLSAESPAAQLPR